VERIQEMMFLARQERSRLQAQQAACAGATRAAEQPGNATGVSRYTRLSWAFAGMGVGALLMLFAMRSLPFLHKPGPSLRVTRLELPAGSTAVLADLQVTASENRASLTRLTRDMEALRNTLAELQVSYRNSRDAIEPGNRMPQRPVAAAVPAAGASPAVAMDLESLPAPSSGDTTGSANDRVAGDGVVPAAPVPGVTSTAMSGQDVEQQAGWAINLASLPVQEDAMHMVAKARALDIPAGLYRISVKGKAYWRVQATGFRSAAEAKSGVPGIEEKLGLKGAWVMRRSE
jgi:hypothetical protein